MLQESVSRPQASPASSSQSCEPSHSGSDAEVASQAKAAPGPCSVYCVVANDRYSRYIGKCCEIGEDTEYVCGWPQIAGKLPIARATDHQFWRISIPATLEARYELCTELAEGRPCSVAMIQGAAAPDI